MCLVELAVTKQKTSGSSEIKGKPEVLTVLPRLYKAKREILSNLSFGARGGSRTRTPLRAPAPEAGESTNSTTRASGVSPFVQRQAVYYHAGWNVSTPFFEKTKKVDGGRNAAGIKTGTRIWIGRICEMPDFYLHVRVYSSYRVL